MVIMVDRETRLNRTNVDTLFEFYRAVNRCDRERTKTLLADSIIWTEKTEDGSTETHTGPESVVRNCLPFMEDDTHMQIVPEQVNDRHDSLIMVNGGIVGVSSTGEPIETRFAHLHEVDNGRISRVESADEPVTIHGANVVQTGSRSAKGSDQ